MKVDYVSDLSNPPFRRSFLAGSSAHLFEVLALGHILDRVRVEQEIYAKCTLKNALVSIWKKGKIKEFYRGLKWNIALSTLKGGCGWSIHNFSNRSVIAICPQKDPIRPSLFFIGTVGIFSAFLETSFILCPLERLKTVEMTKDKYLSMTRDHTRRKGLQFFYQGWSIVMLRQSCSWLSYLGIYQLLRQFFFEYNVDRPLSLKQKALLGGITGGLVASINAPLDLLKTHAQKANVLISEGTVTFMRTILKKYGWKGIYNGLSMKIMRHSWSAITTLIILDHLQALPSNMKI